MKLRTLLLRRKRRRCQAAHLALELVRVLKFCAHAWVIPRYSRQVVLSNWKGPRALGNRVFTVSYLCTRDSSSQYWLLEVAAAQVSVLLVGEIACIKLLGMK